MARRFDLRSEGLLIKLFFRSVFHSGHAVTTDDTCTGPGPSVESAFGTSVLHPIAAIAFGFTVARLGLKTDDVFPSEGEASLEKLLCCFLERTIFDDVIRHVLPGSFATNFASG